MIFYLGLGSNIGDRRAALTTAIIEIGKVSSLSRISPVYETPALTPNNAPGTWNKPYLNLALEIDWHHSPLQLLEAIKAIETRMGRVKSERWAPRVIDIDILLCPVRVEYAELKIPHSELFKRSFVLDPLKDLIPFFQCETEKYDLRKLARALAQSTPQCMNIVNLTPDSFSDGGGIASTHDFVVKLEELERAAVPIVDLGAESTRPGATAVDPQLEWVRLKPYVSTFQSRYQSQSIRPQFSVDTRHFETAQKCLEHGADIINDVSGLTDSRMLALLQKSPCQYILMHSLSVPANPQVTLSENQDVIAELKTWLSDKLKVLQANNIDLKRIIFDPGIGFGKTAQQSIRILQQLHQFHEFPVRILVGHSRKSFMKIFSAAEAPGRDVESVALTVALAGKGVDILRVHDAPTHMRALLARNHVV